MLASAEANRHSEKTAFAEVPVLKTVNRNVSAPSATLRIGETGLDIYAGCNINQLKLLVEIPEDVPVERTEHHLAGEQLTCPKCGETMTEIGSEVVRTLKIIPGGFATPEAIAYIMTQKFVMAAPLYRQEQELKRMGISLSRQTMSNWILRAAKDYLTPVYNLLHEKLLKHEVLHEP